MIMAMPLLGASKDSTLVKKYCIAYNYSNFNKRVDHSLYAYTNIYNKKNDYFIYINYFDRVENNNNHLKDLSWGAFYDYSITKKIFFWSFYQGESVLDKVYNVHQFAGGIGYYVMNNKKGFITMNNGFLLKNIDQHNEYRYVLRFKSRLYLNHNKGYVETYNYFQPSFNNIKDMNFITFNTFTYRIYNKFNFKVYHWLSLNELHKTKFQYLVIGFSFENW